MALSAVLVLFGLRASRQAARAQAPSVVINEVLYDAVSIDTGFEWIELFNPRETAVDLSAWRIERGGTAFEAVFTFPAGVMIAPQAFFVVGESLVEEADLTATLAFQNGGSATDGIRLVDGAGLVVDVLLYDEPNTSGLPDETGMPGTSFAPDVAEGHSLARIPDGTDTNQSAADFADTAAPTPGSPNLLPTPTPTSLPTPSPTPRPAPVGVVVNEALPNPIGNDTTGEFIELFNTSAGPTDLSGAQLDDADGGSTPYTIPVSTTIASGSYLSFSRGETGITLNNEGDRARLLAADGSLVSELIFGSSPAEGAAWARRTDGSADWTTTPTAGGTNVFTPLLTAEPEGDAVPSSPTPTPRTSPTPTPRDAARTVSLLEARALPRGARVRVTGAVSAPPNVLGRGVFYLAGPGPEPPALYGAGSGIQVFVSGGDLPTLALGDRVTVTGTMSAIRNELRIRAAVADVQRVGAGEPPESTAVSTGSLGESLEGTLVRVRGNIARLSGNTFELDDGSGAARVLVKKATGWTRPALRRGGSVTVTGIVSQSGDLYRILPRFADDLRIEGAVAGSAAARSITNRRSRAAGGAVLPPADSRQEKGQAGEAERRREEEPTPAEIPTVPETAETGAAPVSRLPLPTVVAWSGAAVLGGVRLLTRWR